MTEYTLPLHHRALPSAERRHARDGLGGRLRARTCVRAFALVRVRVRVRARARARALVRRPSALLLRDSVRLRVLDGGSEGQRLRHA